MLANRARGLRTVEADVFDKDIKKYISREGFFHMWAMEGNTEEGIETFAVIELLCGQVVAVDPTRIKFTDVD